MANFGDGSLQACNTLCDAQLRPCVRCPKLYFTLDFLEQMIAADFQKENNNKI